MLQESTVIVGFITFPVYVVEEQVIVLSKPYYPLSSLSRLSTNHNPEHPMSPHEKPHSMLDLRLAMTLSPPALAT